RRRRHGRCGDDGGEIGPAAGHVGPFDIEGCGARTRAWVCDRAAAATSDARRGAGSTRVALSGIAPARKSRAAGGGLEGIGDRARSEILPANAEGPGATGDGSGQLEEVG